MIERERTALVILMILMFVPGDLMARRKACTNQTSGGPFNRCECKPCSMVGSTGECSNNHSKKDHSSIVCTCKRGYAGKMCEKCLNGWYRNDNVSHPASFCQPCSCSGNLDLSKPNSCDPSTGKCLECSLNTTGQNCEHCRNGYSGDAIVTKNCTALQNHSLGNFAAKYHRNKDAIIIGVCSGIGCLCLAATGYLIYRHRKSHGIKGRIPKFWTVEISNCNYDDLDFSLLDPVTDTPFVYRNETNDFEEALIAEEKSQLRLDMEVLREVDDTSL